MDGFEECFIVTVDGKKHGPFLAKYRDQYKGIEHLSGIEIKTVWLQSGWVEFAKPVIKRQKKEARTPFLDAMGYVPKGRDGIR